MGYRPPDEKWKKMKEVWDACNAAGVDVPQEVGEFFEWETPAEEGVEVDIEKHECCATMGREFEPTGFIVDVTKLPKDVTLLRFLAYY
jgi:hypothetical protein